MNFLGLKKEEMVKHEEVVKNTDSILGGSSSKDDSSDEDDPFGLNRIFSQSQSQSTLLGTNATQVRLKCIHLYPCTLHFQK